jgi:ParB family chromosome partitioning protein
MMHAMTGGDEAGKLGDSQMAHDVMNEEQLINIRTESLRSRSAALRMDIGEASESIQELARSIEALGIIEPIVVRKAEAQFFEVIAGERRLVAARLLKLEHVPCVIRECSDGEALVAALTENLQRSDLTPIERAEGLQRLLEEFNLTQEEAGRQIGISQSAIAHHLRLLALPLEVRKQVHNGALSMGHAKLLASLQDHQKAIFLAADCISNSRSVRDLECLLSTESPVARKRQSAGISGRQKKEVELANGVYLVIREAAGDASSGTIEIPFYSTQEKEWVLSVLKNGSMTGRKQDERSARPRFHRPQLAG